MSCPKVICYKYQLCPITYPSLINIVSFWSVYDKEQCVVLCYLWERALTGAGITGVNVLIVAGTLCRRHQQVVCRLQGESRKER